MVRPRPLAMRSSLLTHAHQPSPHQCALSPLCRHAGLPVCPLCLLTSDPAPPPSPSARLSTLHPVADRRSLWLAVKNDAKTNTPRNPPSRCVRVTRRNLPTLNKSPLRHNSSKMAVIRNLFGPALPSAKTHSQPTRATIMSHVKTSVYSS